MLSKVKVCKHLVPKILEIRTVKMNSTRGGVFQTPSPTRGRRTSPGRTPRRRRSSCNRILLPSPSTLVDKSVKDDCLMINQPVTPCTLRSPHFYGGSITGSSHSKGLFNCYPLHAKFLVIR